MNSEDEEKLKQLLTSEMVSRVTLAEAINIMHTLAVDEVKKNVGVMSDEEKDSALEELTSKVEPSPEEKKEETSE